MREEKFTGEAALTTKCAVPVDSGLTRISALDGRWLIVIAVSACFFVILTVVQHAGAPTAWHYFGVDYLAPGFADMWCLTSSWDAYRSGHDPIASGAWNYPRIWLIFSFFGLGETHNTILGVGGAICFYATLLLLIRRISLMEGAFYSVLACSPAVMVAVERGNADLLIFSLLGCAAILFRRTAFRWVTYALIAFSVALKLYPICALAAACRERRQRCFAIIGAGTILFIIYIASTWHDVTGTVSTISQGIYISFGRRVFFDRLRDLGLPIQPQIYSLSLLVIVVAVVGALAWRTEVPKFSDGLLEKLAIGGSIYVGTFALLSNYNYRLIFLLFVVPQLLKWCKHVDKVRWLSASGLCAMFVAFCLSAQLHYWQFALKELANWYLFALLLYLLMQLSKQRFLAEFALPWVCRDGSAGDQDATASSHHL